MNRQKRLHSKSAANTKTKVYLWDFGAPIWLGHIILKAISYAVKRVIVFIRKFILNFAVAVCFQSVINEFPGS